MSYGYDEGNFVMRLFLGLGIPALLLAMGLGYSAGREDGLKAACDSVQAEWRNDKCVRVIEEEVK